MKRTLFVALAVAVMLMGIVAYASAVGNTVAVTATVNPMLTLTVDNGDETISLVGDPGDDVVSDTATINVRSNKQYDITRTESGEITTNVVLGPLFTASGAEGIDYAKAPSAGGFDHVETFSLDFGNGTTDDWPDAGTLIETFTYSVVQS
jgi:hypothetical protein